MKLAETERDKIYSIVEYCLHIPDVMLMYKHQVLSDINTYKQFNFDSVFINNSTHNVDEVTLDDIKKRYTVESDVLTEKSMEALQTFGNLLDLLSMAEMDFCIWIRKGNIHGLLKSHNWRNDINIEPNGNGTWRADLPSWSGYYCKALSDNELISALRDVIETRNKTSISSYESLEDLTVAILKNDRCKKLLTDYLLPDDTEE